MKRLPNMKRLPHIALLLALALALTVQPAMAMGPALTALEDMDTESMMYEKYIPELDVSLMLPMDVGFDIIGQNARMTSYMLTPKGFDEDTYFILFSLPAPHLEGKSLADMNDAQLLDVVSVISDTAEDATYELIENYVDGIDVLHVKEYYAPDGIYSEHLVVLRGDHVMNMMAQRLDYGDHLTDEVLAQQADFLKMALSIEGKPERLRSTPLPGSDRVLELPKGMNMIVAGETENLISYAIRPSVDTGGIYYLNLEQNPAFAGETVETVDEASLNAALDSSTLIARKQNTMHVDAKLVPETPILRFHSQYQKAADMMHRFTIVGDVGISLYHLPYTQEMDEDFVDASLDALMCHLLTGEGEMPPYVHKKAITIVDDQLLIPMGSRRIVLPIPDGYVCDIVLDDENDKNVYLVPQAGPEHYLQINMELLGNYSALQDESDDFIAFVAEELSTSMKEEFGNDVTWDFLDEGPLLQPALFLRDTKDMAAFYYMTIDGYIVRFLYFTEDDTPFASGEMEQMRAGIVLEDVETEQSNEPNQLPTKKIKKP